jgi:hypothetical protein
MEKQKKKTVTVSPTSPDTTVTTSLQQKNEMLKAQINALEKEKASTSSQSMTSDSTESTQAAENMTLTLESVQTICERMFSDRMLQIDRKIQLMFEKLLNKQAGFYYC